MPPLLAFKRTVCSRCEKSRRRECCCRSWRCSARFVSEFKEVVVAYVFGAGAVTDAYALAMLIPALGMALFVQAGRRTFLFQYAAYESEDVQAARQFTNRFLTNLLLGSIAFAFVASLGLRWFGHYLTQQDNPAVGEISAALIIPAAWLIVPMALIGGLTAVLNAKGRFSVPQLTMVIPTVAVIAVLIWRGADAGAAGLIVGLFVGSLIQAGVLAMMVMRLGHPLRLDAGIGTSAFWTLWRFAGPLIVLDLISQGNTLVDRWMASWFLESGKVAVLTWGALIKDFLSGTIIASMLAVLLPHFSRQVAKGDTKELGESCGAVIRFAAILLFPLSGLLCVCAPPLFTYFDVGELDQQATRAMSLCLAAYGLGLFTDMVSTTLYQALMALGRLRVLLLLGVFANFIPNIVFNLLLLGPLGEVGLALSTSLVGVSTLLANYLVLRLTIPIEEEAKNLKVMLGALVATAIITAAGFGVLYGVQEVAEAWPPANLVGAVLAAGVAISIYAFLLFLFPGSKDARAILALVRRGRNAEAVEEK